MLSIDRAIAGGRGASAMPACGFVIVDIFRFIKWQTVRSAKSVLMQVLAPLLVLFCLLAAATVALAADAVMLTIKNHQFTPSQVSVPAGERFRVEVENQDATPAEFESADLRVEKIVVPGGKIVVMVGPLKPGNYKFFDDYHPDTATGTMTAVAGKAQD
jgi:heme/copper-type cytochrome/quinol oxidase subunit 2